MRAHVQKLLMCRVKPYYLYQCDLISGSAHLRASVRKGWKSWTELRGHTTGYAVPQYVIDAPGGGGKVPINPEYVLSHNADRVVIRNFEGKSSSIPKRPMGHRLPGRSGLLKSRSWCSSMPRESLQQRITRTKKISAALHAVYPDAHCELNYTNPLELLIATILSAQANDKQVNVVTADLFRKYKTAADFANASAAEFESDIKRIGLYRNKAKNIQACCRALIEKHDGEVPRTMEELTALAGVGRKTANVVLGNAFNMNVGVVVDTHVARLSNRLGLTRETTPEKIEDGFAKAGATRRMVLVQPFDHLAWPPPLPRTSARLSALRSATPLPKDWRGRAEAMNDRSAGPVAFARLRRERLRVQHGVG